MLRISHGSRSFNRVVYVFALSLARSLSSFSPSLSHTHIFYLSIVFSHSSKSESTWLCPWVSLSIRDYCCSRIPRRIGIRLYPWYVYCSFSIRAAFVRSRSFRIDAFILSNILIRLLFLLFSSSTILFRNYTWLRGKY